jgi:fido (protein-threonine AMPylation protein)
MTNSHRGIFAQVEISDAVLASRCSLALSRLSAASEVDALAALADPREIHRSLYRDLAPEDCPEAAGNFRGSNHPSLEDCVVFSSFNETEGTTNIAGPREVRELWGDYAAMLRDYGSRKVSTIDQKLTVVASLMIFFGVIHPFIDGNGHVQRITVQFLIERDGFKMTPAWRIHPCPYGEEFHRALAACDIRKVASMLRGFVE